MSGPPWYRLIFNPPRLFIFFPVTLFRLANRAVGVRRRAPEEHCPAYPSRPPPLPFFFDPFQSFNNLFTPFTGRQGSPVLPAPHWRQPVKRNNSYFLEIFSSRATSPQFPFLRPECFRIDGFPSQLRDFPGALPPPSTTSFRGRHVFSGDAF